MDKVARQACRSSKVSLFETLDEYVQEYSGFSDLALDNFRSIFLYYLLFCSLVFAIFCAFRLVSSTKHIVKRVQEYERVRIFRMKHAFVNELFRVLEQN